MNLLGKLGWGATGVAGLAAGEAVINGPDGIAGNAAEKIMGTIKNPDAITDRDHAFTGFARMIQNLIKLFRNFGGIVDGTVDLKTLFTSDTPTTKSLSAGNNVAAAGNDDGIGIVGATGATLSGYVAGRAVTSAGEATVNRFSPRGGGSAPTSWSDKLFGKSKIGKAVTLGSTLFAAGIGTASADPNEAGEHSVNVSLAEAEAAPEAAITDSRWSAVKKAARDFIPGANALSKAFEGDFSGAAESGTIDAAEIGGAVLGAKAGALAGAFTGPAAPIAVPVLTVVGGIGGAIASSGIVQTAWNGLTSYFNAQSEGQAPEVAQNRAPVRRLPEPAPLPA